MNTRILITGMAGTIITTIGHIIIIVTRTGIGVVITGINRDTEALQRT